MDNKNKRKISTSQKIINYVLVPILVIACYFLIRLAFYNQGQIDRGHDDLNSANSIILDQKEKIKVLEMN